jgi:hypothetical protein
MIQCDDCDRWVHVACDGISDAMFDSIGLRGDVKYHCPECVRRRKAVALSDILDTLQSQDKSKLFWEPVTEEVAPVCHITCFLENSFPSC